MFFRYVFYRLYRHQRARMRDDREAVLSALVFMSLSPLSTIVALHILVSYIRGTMTAFDMYGTWTVAIVLMTIVYTVHYWRLGRPSTVSAIVEECQGKDYLGDSAVRSSWLT